MMVSGGVGSGTYLNTSAIYSPEDGWEEAAELPYPVDWHCQVLSGTSVFITGGKLSDGGKTGNVLEYTNNAWEVLPQNMSTPRDRHACVPMPDDKLRIIGGGDGANNYLRSTEIFSKSSGDWTDGKELPRPVYNGQAFNYNNQTYVLGGDVSYGNPNTAVFSLDLTDPAAEWETLPGVTLEAGRDVFPAQVVNTVTFPCVY